MKNKCNLLIFIFVLLFLYCLHLLSSVEGFGATSPGTMVQLATSHVTTDEDIDYRMNVYPKIVRREITNMTGDDPGEISVFPFA